MIESKRKAQKALDNLDDYARMDIGVDAVGPRATLENYLADSFTTDSLRGAAFALGFNADRLIDELKRMEAHPTNMWY